MSPDRRRILRFALHFALAFPVCLALYPLVLPAYQSLVIGGANLLLPAFAPLLQVELLPDGGWHVWRSPGGGAAGSRDFLYGMRPGALALIYLNLALVPALLAATPVAPARRLRLVALGLALLVAFHVLAVTGLVRTWWCLAQAPEHLGCRSLRGSLKVSGQLFGVVQWALLTWSVWLPGRGADARAADR